MVFLDISRAQCEARLGARTGHFFHKALLASQFEALELPVVEPRVHVIPVADRSAGQVVANVIKALGLQPVGRPQASSAGPG
jgi:gluconate kinase